jgi:hypothetical protein
VREPLRSVALAAYGAGFASSALVAACVAFAACLLAFGLISGEETAPPSAPLLAEMPRASSLIAATLSEFGGVEPQETGPADRGGFRHPLLGTAMEFHSALPTPLKALIEHRRIARSLPPLAWWSVASDHIPGDGRFSDLDSKH